MMLMVENMYTNLDILKVICVEKFTYLREREFGFGYIEVDEGIKGGGGNQDFFRFSLLLS